jgi:hypothetical protein
MLEGVKPMNHQKPTVDECLDALSILWHQVAVPVKAAEAIEKLDRDVPVWRTAPMPTSNCDDESHQAIQRMKAWSRVRSVLRKAGRL